MSKRQLLIILGIWVMIFLFLGFPPAWDKVFGLVVGILIIVIAFKFKPSAKPVSPDRVPYVEHRSSNMAAATPVPEKTAQPVLTSSPNPITNIDQTAS